jgi:TonB-linked SusC/RagA family outer membrane protein
MTTTASSRERRQARIAAHLTACVVTGAILMLTASGVLAQATGGTVVGRVTDPRAGTGIPGATVHVDGMQFGAVAAEDGRYRIVNVPPGARTITARRIGFAVARQQVTIVAGQQVTLDFELQASAIALDEVVVTGTAGGELRRAIGNTVATINAADELAKSAAPNLSGLLNARAPGVIISPSTSRLGAGPSIQIRGRTSIGLDNSPLIYIDGVRVNNATATGPVGVSGGGSSFGAQAATVAGRLNDIRPEDIESIEIIKGPAAATVYGTEAANGVVQIITKKGAAGGKPVLTMNVEQGTIDFRNAAGRVQTNYMKDPATGQIVTWNGVQQEADRGTPIFKTGQTSSFNASLSGARDQLRYYASAGYEDDHGIEPNNSLRQLGFHVNLSAPFDNKTDVATSLNFVSLSNHLGADVGASALLGAEVGHILLFKAARGFYPNWSPEIPQQLYDNAQDVARFTGSATITNVPVAWFTQRLITGLDYTGDDSRAIERFAPPDLAALLSPNSAGGRIGQTLRHNNFLTVDYNGTAKFAMTQSVASTSSLGWQFYRTELNTSSLGGFGFPAAGVETVSAAANQVASTQTQNLNTTIGAYGQQMFAWHDRLFLTGALRVDNNSAFGESFKWVTYPKVSASWVVSEEPFWHWARVANTLRLRAAYGESGRQPATFSALRTFLPVQGPGGSNAVTPGSLGNSDLKPERGKEWELGFEGEFFSRLGLDFTWFSKRTLDEILSQPVAPSSGFSGNRFVNLGEVDNSGVELQATLRVLARRNVTWEMTGNIGTNSDVIKSLGGLPSVIVNAGQFNKVGYPIGGIFTKRVVSADRDATTGFATNVLCDGGPGAAPVACAQAPFVFIGTPTPKAVGSFGNSVTIGNRLRLYGLFDFKRGHRVANSIEQLRCTGAVGAGLCRANYFPLEYSPVYLAETVGNAASQGILDQYYQDGSFVKLREVSATWTLPERWIPRATRTTLTLAARDLLTWTNYRGPDPEVNVNNPATSSSTADQAVTPPFRRFIATLNFVF